MTLKERLEDYWRNGRVFNPCHINYWNCRYGIVIDEELKLFLAKGRKVQLKGRRGKNGPRAVSRFTPQGLIWYRAERKRFIEQVEKARKVLGLSND